MYVHAFHRKHKDVLMITPVDSTIDITPEHSNDGDQAQSSSNDLMDVDNSECMLASIKKIDIKSHAAQFILKTRDGVHLTQTNADRIVQDAKMMVQSTIDSLRVQLVEKIKEYTSLPDEKVEEIAQVLHEHSLNPFDGLETLYLQVVA